MEVGSIIRPSATKAESMRSTMDRRELQIEQLLAEKKIAPSKDDGRYYEVLYPLSFKSPSTMALFVLGRSANGWTEFVGLDELRESPASE